MCNNVETCVSLREISPRSNLPNLRLDFDFPEMTFESVQKPPETSAEITWTIIPPETDLEALVHGRTFKLTAERWQSQTANDLRGQSATRPCGSSSEYPMNRSLDSCSPRPKWDSCREAKSVKPITRTQTRSCVHQSATTSFAATSIHFGHRSLNLTIYFAPLFSAPNA